MRLEKTSILNEITERLQASDCTIVLSYGGLTVAELYELRKAVLPLEGRCTIAKNTLIAKAAKDLGWADITSMLTGPSAVVTGKGDVAELAKIVCQFVKTHNKAAVKGVSEIALTVYIRDGDFGFREELRLYFVVYLGVAPDSRDYAHNGSAPFIRISLSALSNIKGPGVSRMLPRRAEMSAFVSIRLV